MISHVEFIGDRLPQIGELVELPGFSGDPGTEMQRTFKVNGMSGIGDRRKTYSKYYSSRVYIDSSDIGDDDYWRGQWDRNSKENWAREPKRSYSTDRFIPSDWKDPELKFREREFVLRETKPGSDHLSFYGRFKPYLDTQHDYLGQWFPDLEGVRPTPWLAN